MLTQTAIQNAKPKDKPYKLFDGGGLFLLVTPRGGKWWRFKYRYQRKAKTLSMGTYPETPLRGHRNTAGVWVDGARDKRDQARRLLIEGVDPSAERKRKLGRGDSLEAIGREWFEKQKPAWAASHASRVIGRLERDVFPWLGTYAITAITAPDLLGVLRRVEGRGAVETAHRLLQYCSQIFRYAIATGRAEHNLAADLQGALAPVAKAHFAALTEPKAVGQLARALDGYQGSFVVKCALRLAPLVFVRPGELRQAEWAEIDLDTATWQIRPARMKMKQAHIVPLSQQAVDILRDLHALTGSGRYVFPGERSSSRPMSENAVLMALRSLGYSKDQMTGHGFRALARTILDEVLGFRPELIEQQLAHTVRDPLGRAYNRTTHLAERRKMMSQWASYLDGLKAVADVIPLHR